MPSYRDKYGNSFQDYSTGTPSDQADYSAVSSSLPEAGKNYGASRPALRPEYKGGTQYLPGYGNLGPDLEGAVKADRIKQEMQIAQDANARAEEELGINKEELGVKKDYLSIAMEDLGIRKADLQMRQDSHANEMKQFGWQEKDRQKSEILKANMADAMQQGGYSAVVELLKSQDPAQAIQFHSEKLKLDAQIMGNEVMQAVGKNEIDKAMVESYATLGKFGAAINQAKTPEEADAMYKQILPMIKKINPEAPNSLEKARSMLSLAAAQATPADQLFKANNGAVTMNSNVAKIDSDIQSRIRAGVPMDDPGMQALVAARDTYVAKGQQAIIQKTATELRMKSQGVQNESTVYRNTQGLQKDIATASKDYLGFMDTYTGVKATLETLQKDPTNSAAQGSLGRLMAAAVQKGVLTDKDVSQTVMSEAGVNELIKNYANPWAKGELTNLSPREIKNLSNLFDSTAKMKTERQNIIEGQFKDTLGGYGDVIKKDQIRFPSEQYQQMEASAKLGRISKQYGLDQMPPQIQSMAAEAIDAGKDPRAVVQMANQMMQQAAKQTQQQAGQQ